MHRVLISTVAILASGCTSSPGEASTFRPIILESGRLQCPHHNVADEKGDLSPDGQYLAVPTRCRVRGSRPLQGHIELIDLERGRRVFSFNPHGREEGMTFLSDGTLVQAVWNANGAGDEYPSHVQFYTWRPDAYESPPEFSFHIGPEGSGSSIWSFTASPLDDTLTTFWSPRFNQDVGGAIVNYSFSKDEPEVLSLLNNDNLDWLSGEPTFFPKSGFWSESGFLFIVASGGNFLIEGSDGPDVFRFDWILPIDHVEGFEINDNFYDILADTRYSYYWTFQDGNQIPVGTPIGIFEQQSILLSGGTDLHPGDDPSNAIQYEVQVRRLSDMAFVGGVENGPPGQRVLADFEVSHDGESIYLLYRVGVLEIRDIHSWDLLADYDVEELGLDFAWDIYASPVPGRVVLVNERQWVHVELD